MDWDTFTNLRKGIDLSHEEMAGCLGIDDEIYQRYRKAGKLPEHMSACADAVYNYPDRAILTRMSREPIPWANLERLRVDSGLTQDNAAYEIGVAYVTYQSWRTKGQAPAYAGRALIAKKRKPDSTAPRKTPPLFECDWPTMAKFLGAKTDLYYAWLRKQEFPKYIQYSIDAHRMLTPEHMTQLRATRHKTGPDHMSWVAFGHLREGLGLPSNKMIRFLGVPRTAYRGWGAKFRVPAYIKYSLEAHTLLDPEYLDMLILMRCGC